MAHRRSQPGDLIVPKRRFSGFFETDLDRLLRERGVTSLVFTGCTTSVCVESTLRDAFYRDYACLLLTDCCAEVIGSDTDRTNHDATITVIEAVFGWTTASDRFLGALSEKPAGIPPGIPRETTRETTRESRRKSLGNPAVPNRVPTGTPREVPPRLAHPTAD